MVSDYLRRAAQPLLSVLVRAIAHLGLTPNGLTVIGFLLNVAVATVLASGYLRLGGVLVFLVSLLDSLDGALARYTKNVTPFGAFFDSTLDRYSVSYTRARAEGLGLECKVGLFTRVERMVVLSFGLVLGLPTFTLWVLAVFSHFTALQRIWHVRQLTRRA